VTCLDGCNVGFSACAASIRGPAGVAVAEIFIDDPGAETVEWDCWAYEDTHKTIATRTSNGLKSRRNRRTLRFIVVTMERRRPSILSGKRKLFPRKRDLEIAHGGLETAAPCWQTDELSQE
jgi:hypothetical protein